MALNAGDYAHKGPKRLYDGYFEIVDAHHKDVAKACGCEIGQSVGRIYINGGGCAGELIGTREEAEAFVVERMEALKVEA